ncbi:hypothetical protein SB861_53125 [Paraburkholderia sp. SIMBA_049]
MAKPQVIEPHKNRHVLKVAAVTGQNPVRDVALLTMSYGTGLIPNEVAKLRVSDYLIEDGQIRVDSKLRPEIPFNGKARPFVWANAKTCAAIDSYLAYRLSAHHGIRGSHPFRGATRVAPRKGRPPQLARDLGMRLFEWFPGHADLALAAWMTKQTMGGKPVVFRRSI